MGVTQAVKTALSTDMQALHDELLSGAPDFLDLPDRRRKELEKNVMRRERVFWLQTRRVMKNFVSEALVRRAIYAEERAHDAEMRLGELALICNGMKDEVDRLQGELTKLAKGIK